MDKTNTHPTVRRLADLQGGESDNRFAQRWLSMSGTSWYRLKTGDYQADPEKLLSKCEGGLQQLEDYLAGLRKRGQRGRVLELRPVTKLLDAVKVAQAEPRDRLAVLLAPTGGGKSTVVSALQERYAARVVAVEATESWRESYLAATLAITTALRVKEVASNKRQAEAALLAHLKEKPCILVIDEAHYFGPSTINLVKAIANQTTCTLVLLAIPALWARLKRAAWEEAEQIRSRTAATIEVREVGEKDLDSFVTDRLAGAKEQLKSDWKEALTDIGESANRFGLWDTVERVCAVIHEEAEGGPITLEMVKAAIKNVEATRR